MQEAGPDAILPRVYLSIGSNVEPMRNIASAIDALRRRFGGIAVSPLYRSVAVGFDGPDFVNGAIAIDSDLDPAPLNDWLHDLEDRHGRRRDVPRFSDRTLDIDIVLYGDLVLAGVGNLKVPRDELRHAFVLRPLLDLAPLLRDPRDGVLLSTRWPTADAGTIAQLP